MGLLAALQFLTRVPIRLRREPKLDAIVAAHPEKEMLRLCSHRCPHMGEITLEQTRDSLKYLRWVIDVPEDIRVRALRSVERMLAVGPKVD